MVTPQTMTRFISCDWGTSRLRLRLIELTPRRIMAEHATDEGIQHLANKHIMKIMRKSESRPTLTCQQMSHSSAHNILTHMNAHSN